MKIRNGFVSNSSSSSFVLVGVAVSVEEYDREGFIDRLKSEADLDWLLDSDGQTLYIGHIVSSTHDDGDDLPDVFELARIGTKVAEGLKKMEIPFSNNHIVLNTVIQDY